MQSQVINNPGIDYMQDEQVLVFREGGLQTLVVPQFWEMTTNAITIKSLI